MSNLRLCCALALVLSASPAIRADVLWTRSGKVEGTILRVNKDAVQIKAGPGETSVGLAEILRVDMPVPADYRNGLTAFRSAKYTDAIISFKPLADRYAGLPLQWVLDSLIKLGDAYLGNSDTGSAKTVLEKLRKTYPRTPEAENLDLKFARIHALEKDCTKALELANPALEKLIGKQFWSSAEEASIGDGLSVVAECSLATGKKEDALNAYLKMIALFSVDPARMAEAQYKVGMLFEDLGNWKRAKTYYADLLKDAPSASFAGDVKRRFDAIQQAHPE